MIAKTFHRCKTKASALQANGGSQGAASEHGVLNVQPKPTQLPL